MAFSPAVEWILVVSILIQGIAAFMAIRLIGITGRQAAWGMIAGALVLMAVRRAVPLVRMLLADQTIQPDPLNEVIGLVLSLLMAAGIAGIAPIFLERRRAEAALRSREEQFRVLTEATPDIIVRFDPECRQVYVNPAYERLTGFSHGEIAHLAPGSEWRGGVSTEEYGAQLRQVMKTGEPTERVVRWRNDQGQEITHLAHFLPERDAEGKITGAFTVARDITALKDTEKRLKSSETRYHQVFNASLDAMYLMEVTPDGRFRTLDVNPAFEKALGIRREDLILQFMEDAPIPPDTIRQIIDKLNRCVQSESPIREEAIYSPSMGRRFFDTVLVPMRDEGGRLYRILGILSDIEERKKAEQEHQSHMRFMECMDRVSRAMQGTDDLDHMMSEVLGAVREIFDCDRAWLLFPCDPNSPSWNIPMERTRPGYAGAMTEKDIPMDPGMATAFAAFLDSGGPVAFGQGNEHPLPSTEVAGRFGFQSVLGMVLRPGQEPTASAPGGSAWLFGLHQCSSPRAWTDEERRLFQEIGRRLSDALTMLLGHRHLLESEHRYREVFENTSDGIFLIEVTTDSRFRFVEFNPAEERSTGFLNASTAGKYVEEAIPPELTEQITANYRRCVESGGPINYEEELALPGGTRSFSTTLIPIRDATGRISRLIGIARDITERSAMLRTLETKTRHDQSLLGLSRSLERAQSYEDVLNAAFTVIQDVLGYQRLWLYLFDDDRVHAHGLIKSFVGAPVELPYLTIPGDRMLEEIVSMKEIIIVEEASTDPRTNKEIVAQLGNRSIVNVPIILFDNHFGSMGTGTFGDEGVRVPTPIEKDFLMAIASHVAVSLDRIHSAIERKRAEERALQLAGIVESSEDAIVGKTLDGFITSWNLGAEHMFGYGAEEAVGRSIAILIPEDRAREEAEILEKLKGGVTIQHHETVRRCKDGRLVDVSVSISPVRNREGMLIGVSSIARDITYRVKAEAELRKHKAHLEELVAARTADLENAYKEMEAFSYSVSHDLRTPLRAIDGFSRMLANRYAGALDDEAKRLIHVVRDNSAKMSQLIDDILAFSRSGRTEMKLTDVDMQQMVMKVWMDLEPSRSNRKVNLHVDPLPAAQGDPALLRQVWINLLSNAIKFTKGRPEARVEVGGSVEGREIVYSVKDNGVGFDQTYVHKLFGVFERLHRMDEFEGTGIGLAIVKRIVNRHGGRVEAEGRVDEGATIRFTLPIGEHGPSAE